MKVFDGILTDVRSQGDQMLAAVGVNTPKRIMVVIPGRLFRNGIEHVLQAAGGHVVCGCETLEQAETVLQTRADLQPDLFVIGVDAPGRAGADLTQVRALRAKLPNCRWIVLTGSCGGPEFWWQAVESRVDGVLHEDSPGEVLQLLVRLILLGYSFLPTGLPPDGPAQTQLMEADPSRPDPAPDQLPTPDLTMRDIFLLSEQTAPRPPDKPESRWRTGLSQRERDILRGLVAGQSNKAIARDFNISEATVKVHVKALLRKMQVTNRTQAAISALQFLAPRQDTKPASPPDGEGVDDNS